MKMNSKTFDVLKWVAMLALPALATLISTVGSIWGLPYTEEISRTVVAVNAALAAVLGISSANYYKDQEPKTMLDATEGEEIAPGFIDDLSGEEN